MQIWLYTDLVSAQKADGSSRTRLKPALCSYDPFTTYYVRKKTEKAKDNDRQGRGREQLAGGSCFGGDRVLQVHCKYCVAMATVIWASLAGS